MSRFLTSETSSKNVTSLDSSPFARKELSEQYWERGYTDVVQILGPVRIAPIQQFLYEQTRHLLEDHDPSWSLERKLSLPMRDYPDDTEWSKLMGAMNESLLVQELIDCDEIKHAFERVFMESVEAFPISKFRAQYPREGRAIYGWHQDEGTWYAVPVKTLAYRMPATLWFSINGADEYNSIEIAPGSHRGRLANHLFVERQGYFSANLPKEYEDAQTVIVKTKPGQGVLFHPLVFHRSIKMQSKKPRYSIDIRYCTVAPSNEKYKVQPIFYLKRLLKTRVRWRYD